SSISSARSRRNRHRPSLECTECHQLTLKVHKCVSPDTDRASAGRHLSEKGTSNLAARAIPSSRSEDQAAIGPAPADRLRTVEMTRDGGGLGREVDRGWSCMAPQCGWPASS